LQRLFQSKGSLEKGTVTRCCTVAFSMTAFCTKHLSFCLQSFFQSKQSLEKGTVITLLWRPEGVLEILLRASDDGLDYSRVSVFPLFL
jgi:hypothetical protein